jgi:hypothetical protein
MKLKYLLAVMVTFMLAACEQAQMQGPIGGASVTVSELRTGNVVISGLGTSSEATANALWDNWDEFEPFVKLLVLGIHQFGDPSVFDDDTFYVMSVAGGEDYGFDTSTSSQVFGTVNAIVSGAKLKEANFTLSPLTESAYQFLKDHVATLNNSEIQVALDALASDLVGDVDGDGQINYIDVLTWNRLLHPAFLAADAGAVDSLTQAMTEVPNAATLQALSANLFSANSPAGVAEAFFAANVNQPVSQNKCRTCHRVGGIAGGTRHIVTSGSTAGAIASNVGMYRALVGALGVTGIMNKASMTGVTHTGGKQLNPGTTLYNDFEAFLNLL